MSRRMGPIPGARVPGDKSLTHRALMLGAIARGTSIVRDPLDAADTRSTADVLTSLGVELIREPGLIRVRGVGLDGPGATGAVLDCGNSGTTARLLLGLLAGCPGEAIVTGDASLRARPMRRVTGPLALAGADFEELEREDRLPIRVRGARPLRPLDHASPRSSAQVKSAILLAGLTGRCPVRFTEPGRSRDHTERLLRAMGADVATHESDGLFVHEAPVVDRLDPLDIAIPGDFSSGAFFLALGALAGPLRVERVGLNPTRTRALDVLRRMGARVAIEETPTSGPEPAGRVTVEPGALRGTVVEPAEIPMLLDEIPALAVVAACARGETRFEGVAELRVKETDRVAALVANLAVLGVETDDGPDHLVVAGRPGTPLRGTVSSAGDHRIAMAFGVLGAVAGNEIRVEDAAAVDISFPGFWEELERVAVEVSAP